MRYAIAAILLLYAALCLIWPGHVFRALQGRMANTMPAGYARGSTLVIRLLGAAIVVAVPALYLLGYAQ